MARTFGLPLGDGAIRKPLNQLIRDHNLPLVVFHSLSSITYKLKLNGGDIKAVQAIPEGVDAELFVKVINNPETAALLTLLAKTMK